MVFLFNTPLGLGKDPIPQTGLDALTGICVCLWPCSSAAVAQAQQRSSAFPYCVCDTRTSRSPFYVENQVRLF